MVAESYDYQVVRGAQAVSVLMVFSAQMEEMVSMGEVGELELDVAAVFPTLLSPLVVEGTHPLIQTA